MKEEASPILKKLGKDPGFKVPENYFEDFNERMAAMLPEVEITDVEQKPSLWMRVRPIVYLAAMFAGVWCMMQVFTHFPGAGDPLQNVNRMAEEMGEETNTEDFIMSNGVSDYDIYNYEDSVNMSNDEDTTAPKPAHDKNK